MITDDSADTWQASASLKVLKQRAALYKTVRHFLTERGVLEVETPVLGQAATVDPFIDSLTTTTMGEDYYLQTSPEFFLKRLLATHYAHGCATDVFSLGKVFRQGERGVRHHPEFTLLEWYRLGWNEKQLMEEVISLIQTVFAEQQLPQQKVSYFTYQQLFIEQLDIDPHSASDGELKDCVAKHIEIDSTIDRNACLDLLMTHCIEPQLPTHLVFVHDYPAIQSALARIDQNKQGQLIARRFELYLQRLELANGYFELTDAEEQQRRFEADCHYRQQQRLSAVPYDKKMVAALASGLPDCAGVALGIDRLLMVIAQCQSIQEVISFADG